VFDVYISVKVFTRDEEGQIFGHIIDDFQRLEGAQQK